MRKFSQKEAGIGERPDALADSEQVSNDRREAISTAPLVASSVAIVDKNWFKCYDAYRYSDEQYRYYRFISCLREKTINHWDTIHQYDLTMPGGITRDISTLGMNDSVRNLDRTRVVALLDAWLYGAQPPFEEGPEYILEPYYLDAELVGQLYRDHEAAYRKLGIPQAIYPEPGDPDGDTFYTIRDIESARRALGIHSLMRRDDPVFIPSKGPLQRIDVKLTERHEKRIKEEEPFLVHLGLDRYLSELLEWEYEHCFGLLLDIGAHWYAKSQAGGELELVFRAALEWISFCQQEDMEGIYIYSRYPEIRDVSKTKLARLKRVLDYKNYGP